MFALGLHDRKLRVLGLCTLIFAAPLQPGVIDECAQQIVPTLLFLLSGLNRSHAVKAAETECDDLNREENEDYVDHESQDHMGRLQVPYFNAFKFLFLFQFNLLNRSGSTNLPDNLPLTSKL